MHFILRRFAWWIPGQNTNTLLIHYITNQTSSESTNMHCHCAAVVDSTAFFPLSRAHHLQEEP